MGRTGRSSTLNAKIWGQQIEDRGTQITLSALGQKAPHRRVSEMASSPGVAPKLRYSAGLMVLSEEAPEVIRYRSSKPVLAPELLQERQGIVANVVFPTAIDRRNDLGSPDRFDVYYGMADSRIGVAKLVVPERLGAVATVQRADR